jgi:hypothetical membrane protein
MTNYISDLGNTTCGPFQVGSAVQYVCSPWHPWMNLSFILLGVAIVLGATLLKPELPVGLARGVGLALLALAGPGIIAVGLFPEDVNLQVHKAGAAVQFISGNLGLVVLGIAMVRRQRGLMLPGYSITSGGIGLAATGLFVWERYLGLGVGGMERLAVYPLPIWLIVVGACLHGTLVRTPPNERLHRSRRNRCS